MARPYFSNVESSPCRVCPCCFKAVVYLYPSEGAKKRQVPVLVGGDEKKPPWNGSPVYDINRHARHSGWVFKQRLKKRELRAKGYTEDEIQIILQV